MLEGQARLNFGLKKPGEEAAVIEMESDNKNNIKVRENYSDSVFNAVKLSFKDVEDKFVDVRIGSSC